MAHHCKLLAVVVAIAALANAARPAAASTPPGSEGCRVPAPQRVVGEITHATWPIVQSRPDGTEIRRTYSVHVPPQHQNPQLQALPIVFDLHAALSSGFQQNMESRMSTKGREEGFIVVQPDSWSWWASSPVEEALRGGVSDIDYIARLLRTFDQKLCFDRNRIFAVSSRYTAWMAPMLACASARGELGGKVGGELVRHKIAAVAIVSSFPIPVLKGPPWAPHTLPTDLLSLATICAALKGDPTPLLVIFSDNDLTLGTLVGAAPGSTAAPRAEQPIDELEAARTAISRLVSREDATEHSAFRVLDGSAKSPAEVVLQLACVSSAIWARDNGCNVLGMLFRCSQLKSPTASSPVAEWGKKGQPIEASCTSVANRRAEVRFIAVGTGSYDRNGHVWPGGLAGGEMSATKEIWDFFKDHSR